jgi:hypothetical protein
VKGVVRLLICLSVLVLAACSSNAPPPSNGSGAKASWADEDVRFVADGLTIHGSYRHSADAKPGPAVLLISESGNTDRDGNNAVAGPVGNMRQLAEFLSDKGIASLRYDKVGTGKTGLGPYTKNPRDVGSAIYTAGAKAAVRYLAAQPATDKARISVYGLGEGTVHALNLATSSGTAAASDVPPIHSLALLQPLSGRYLDIITRRVQASVDADVKAGAKTRQQGDEVLATWTATVATARTTGVAPPKLPEGLGAILNPSNVKAVLETDAIDPLALAAKLPAAMPVLLTCSDSDGQASCPAEKELIGALAHTRLTVAALKGVNHVLRDDPTDNVANYAKQAPLSPQLIRALSGFVGR